MSTTDPPESITRDELADFLESVNGQRRDRAEDLAGEALAWACRNREPADAAPPVAAALDRAQVATLISRRTGLYGIAADDLADAICGLAQNGSEEDSRG